MMPASRKQHERATTQMKDDAIEQKVSLAQWQGLVHRCSWSVSKQGRNQTPRRLDSFKHIAPNGLVSIHPGLSYCNTSPVALRWLCSGGWLCGDLFVQHSGNPHEA